MMSGDLDRMAEYDKTIRRRQAGIPADNI